MDQLRNSFLGISKGSTTYRLRCLIQGEDTPFLLKISDSEMDDQENEIGDLKKEIYKECNQDVFGKTLPRNLVIVKVGMP
jgi:hypothetical protein